VNSGVKLQYTSTFTRHAISGFKLFISFCVVATVSPVVCVFKVNLYCRVEIMLNGGREDFVQFEAL